MLSDIILAPGAIAAPSVARGLAYPFPDWTAGPLLVLGCMVGAVVFAYRVVPRRRGRHAAGISRPTRWDTAAAELYRKGLACGPDCLVDGDGWHQDCPTPPHTDEAEELWHLREIDAA